MTMKILHQLTKDWNLVGQRGGITQPKLESSRHWVLSFTKSNCLSKNTSEKLPLTVKFLTMPREQITCGHHGALGGNKPTKKP